MISVDIVEYLGDLRNLHLPKTAFLCSRRVPAGAILKCYDWAAEARDAGRCVISGFHSPIEKDVLYYLLKGNQPVIIALHRGIGPQIESRFAAEIEAGKLLIVSPFARSIRRGDARTAAVRNRLMVTIADSITIGYASPDGELSKIVSQATKPASLLFE
jgi:predicted Rossmann fold nucleotide-binding protein DprA/Smf involved in DNA uptake